MKELHREPTVENKYNLTVVKVRKLRLLVQREKLEKYGFWRNTVIDAWCLSGKCNPRPRDSYETFADSYWIGFYDEDAKHYAGKTRVTFDSFGGMCSYKFNKFYNPNDIDYDVDLKIQEMFLKTINNLIDKKVIGFVEEEV